ncbi:MAG: hypothetical protein UC708_01365 [Anaerovoracaceae bacterium]|nr:hypothetical protein [Bacillota bacterium]MEE0516505.1 hypothetical protein [Anaerovoracaceae bacterium]
MYQIKEKMSQMLSQLEKKLISDNMELEECPAGQISCTKRQGKNTYFRVEVQEGHRKRTSINKNQKLIEGLARKKYLSLEVSRLEKNINIIKALMADYLPDEVDDILREMPSPIQAYCLPKISTQSWSNVPYNMSTYMPERKVHTTSRGLKVRSKSELLIVEKLYEHDIEFRYEQVLRIDNVDFAPDFTIRTRNGGIIYWEHCGLTNNDKYLKAHKRKLEIYEQAGIVPWKNLIISYDDEYGILNLAIVESEIINKIEKW